MLIQFLKEQIQKIFVLIVCSNKIGNQKAITVAPSTVVTKYWVRVRVVSIINVVPQLEFINNLPSFLLIRNDGFTERFGKACPTNKVFFHRKLSEEIAGEAPTNEVINFSTDISINTIDSEFSSTQLRAIGGILRLPENINTAQPLQISLSWYINGGATGQFQWYLEVALAKLNDDVNSSSLPTTTMVRNYFSTCFSTKSSF